MSLDITNLANKIFQNLSAQDGINDNKVGYKAKDKYDASIWNKFANAVGGKKIQHYIEQANAIKSIETYLKRANGDAKAITSIMTAASLTADDVQQILSTMNTSADGTVTQKGNAPVQREEEAIKK